MCNNKIDIDESADLASIFRLYCEKDKKLLDILEEFKNTGNTKELIKQHSQRTTQELEVAALLKHNNETN